MASVKSNSGTPSVQQQADAWVLRIKSGSATTRDAQMLRNWCAAHPDHAQAFDRARRAWDELGQVGRAFREAHSEQRASRPGRRLFLGTALAAGGAAAIAAVVHPPLGLWPSVFELDSDYRTATGEQRRVNLASGVDVELNTRSSLSVKNAGRDEIELIAGEAAISRSREQGMLQVVAGNGRASLGVGDIEIRFLAGQVCVTCLRGSAEVHHPSGAAALRPGEQVVYDQKRLAAVAEADTARISAWRDGSVLFRNTLLIDAVAEINRYRPGRVVVLDGPLGQRRVSGKFQIARLDLAIDRIEEVFGVRVRKLPGGLVLLG